MSPLLSLTDVESRRAYLLSALRSSNERCGRITDLRNLVQTCVSANRGTLSSFRTYPTSMDGSTQTAPLISQYQPLRKGIVNMIRIQADKAIAMPTDTRLQILAVSKDIIHS